MSEPTAKDLIAFLRAQSANWPPDSSVDPRMFVGALSQWESDQTAKAVAAAVQKIEHEEALQVHIKFSAMMIEKGSAYTNLLIVAGYASFFAIMPLAGNLITKDQRRASLLLLVVSLCAFVGFEVFKMLFMQFAMLGRYDKFNREAKQPGFLFVAESLKLQKDLAGFQTRFVRLWIASTAVSILSGIAAVGILAAAFVVDLLTT